MYLAAITIFLCAAYFLVNPLFGLFFQHDHHLSFLRTCKSVTIIALASVLSYWLSFSIQDVIWENRILHALGGGFLAILVCFLVVRDSNIKINCTQFVVLSILIATLLGVGNELLECILQNYTPMVFAETINDTWLDLVSNTVGIIVGVLAFTPFIKIRKSHT